MDGDSAGKARVGGSEGVFTLGALAVDGFRAERFQRAADGEDSGEVEGFEVAPAWDADGVVENIQRDFFRRGK